MKLEITDFKKWYSKTLKKVGEFSIMDNIRFAFENEEDSLAFHKYLSEERIRHKICFEYHYMEHIYIDINLYLANERVLDSLEKVVKIMDISKLICIKVRAENLLSPDRRYIRSRPSFSLSNPGIEYVWVNEKYSDTDKWIFV